MASRNAHVRLPVAVHLSAKSAQPTRSEDIGIRVIRTRHLTEKVTPYPSRPVQSRPHSIEHLFADPFAQQIMVLCNHAVLSVLQ